MGLTEQQTDSITDTTREQLQTIQNTRSHSDLKVVKDLKKRSLLTIQKVISYKIEKGPNFATTLEKEETDLMSDMLERLDGRSLSRSRTLTVT